MIRRTDGDDFLLIAQTDHAALAGELAARFGNAKFARPEEKPGRPQPRQAVLTAVSMHDAGWPLHDDQPTLNPRGLPLDVFETPRAIDLMVWEASADRAAEVDPHAGLLVSLHSLALSLHVSASPVSKDNHFDPQQMHEQFILNKFQHREVERQEQLRRQLGLNVNLPLKHGLAEAHTSPEEDGILFAFRLLQAMDLMSLCLCCEHPPQDRTNDVLRTPGGEATTLRLRKISPAVLKVDPWPFDVDRLEFNVPCRRIRSRRFESVEEFRLAYRAAGIETIGFTVQR